MRGAVLHAPGDIRVEQRPDPTIQEPTDAIIRLSATCVCGSDLWPYRGIEKSDGPAPMGHEYVGIVEEVGDDVRNLKPGQFVVGSFFASDNTCEICQAGRLANLGLRPNQTRSTALFQLATEIPAAILARTLGIHTHVAVTWQRLSGGDWASYAAQLSQRTAPPAGGIPRV